MIASKHSDRKMPQTPMYALFSSTKQSPGAVPEIASAQAACRLQYLTWHRSRMIITSTTQGGQASLSMDSPLFRRLKDIALKVRFAAISTPCKRQLGWPSTVPGQTNPATLTIDTGGRFWSETWDVINVSNLPLRSLAQQERLPRYRSM